MNPELLSVIREEYARVAYSFKAHEKMLDRYNTRLRWQKGINAALLTLTTGSTIDVLVNDAYWSKILIVILTGLALALAIYQLSVNGDRLVDQHRVAARALWLIREEYLHLISDLRSGSVDEGTARKMRDELTLRTAHVYESAPDTDSKAYIAAQRALKDNEELTFSTKEIDLLLPVALRESKP